jgi:hypothetical protein
MEIAAIITAEDIKRELQRWDNPGSTGEKKDG